tara:strand:- start:539 stop:787 length:249 start_codon:yes stop_codon:yes gene_type:complete
MASSPPSLDRLIMESHFIEMGIELAKQRIQRKQSIPDYMYRSIRMLKTAYVLSARRHYPDELANRVEDLQTRFDELKEMYES